MKAVFVGPCGSGQSTLINRILGGGFSPAGSTDNAVTRNILTFRNTLSSCEPFKLTITRRTTEEMCGVFSVLEDARRVFHECTFGTGEPEDEELLAWLAETPSPWMPLYDYAEKLADIVMGWPHETALDVVHAIGEMTGSGGVDLFIDNILIEGSFPNLGPGGSLVDLPYYGQNEILDERIDRELVGATHAFYVMEYRRSSIATKREECRALGKVLPRELPINICITHASAVFDKVRSPTIGSDGKRARLAIRPRDVQGVIPTTAGFVGRSLSVRYFENGDPSCVDEHLFVELLAFLKREAVKIAQ